MLTLCSCSAYYTCPGTIRCLQVRRGCDRNWSDKLCRQSSARSWWRGYQSPEQSDPSDWSGRASSLPAARAACTPAARSSEPAWTQASSVLWLITCQTSHTYTNVSASAEFAKRSNREVGNRWNLIQCRGSITSIYSCGISWLVWHAV